MKNKKFLSLLFIFSTFIFFSKLSYANDIADEHFRKNPIIIHIASPSDNSSSSFDFLYKLSHPPYYFPLLRFSVLDKDEKSIISNNIILALLGSLQHQFILSSYFQEGYGLKKNMVHAYAWLKLAIKKGYKIQFKLDELKEKEKLSPETIAKGEELAENLFNDLKIDLNDPTSGSAVTTVLLQLMEYQI